MGPYTRSAMIWMFRRQDAPILIKPLRATSETIWLLSPRMLFLRQFNNQAGL